MKGDLAGIPVMLVGNKSDEETSKRQVAKKMGEALQVKSKYSIDVEKKNIDQKIHWIFRLFGPKI